MRVALFFDPPRPWTWASFLSGELGLSGTDAQVLRVAKYLTERGETQVLLLQTRPPGDASGIESVEVVSSVDAVRAAHRHGAEVVVINNRGNAMTRDAIALAEQLSQPLVLWDQNGPADELADVAADSTMVRRVLCVSGTQCDWIRHHRVFSKAQFIYNSIDPQFYRHDPNVPREDGKVVYVGSLTPAKGFHLLAAAWPAVRRQFAKARLVVIGSARLYSGNEALGPLGVATPEYEATYLMPLLGRDRTECAANGVEFLGLAAPVDVRRELQTASVGVVNPHTRGSVETFCVSAIEMQASGTPVVGGRAGGLLETVQDGQTGLLARNSGELSAAIVELLQHPARARRMGTAGQAFVETQFGPGAVGDQWDQLLRRIVQNEPAAPPALCWKRATPSTVMKQGLRLGRDLPVLGRFVPSMHDLRRVSSAVRGVMRA